MKYFQGRRFAVGVFGEKEICNQCLCIHILVGGEDKTLLVPASEPAEFLPHFPLEEHLE